MKKKIMAVLAVIAAVLGFGFATNTAMADDYGATVTYSGTTATVTFPAGTFQPNESVTVYYDDAIVADVQQIAEVSKTFTAKADGSLTLLYTFKASQAGKTIAVKAVGAVSGTKTATIQVPATGTGDQSGTYHRQHRCGHRTVRCGRCAACRRGHRPVRRPQEHHSSLT